MLPTKLIEERTSAACQDDACGVGDCTARVTEQGEFAVLVRGSAGVTTAWNPNLALAQPLPPFNFFEPNAPIYTQENYLPASKLNKCAIDHVVIGDGPIPTDSSLHHCVLGIRSFVGEGSSLEDTVVMGADYYEGDEHLERNVEKGRPHLGIGKNCRIKGAIIDKNARIAGESRGVA